LKHNKEFEAKTTVVEAKEAKNWFDFVHKGNNTSKE